jgi:hypothetical protein
MKKKQIDKRVQTIRRKYLTTGIDQIVIIVRNYNEQRENQLTTHLKMSI